MPYPEGWVYHWVGSHLPDNPTETQSKATLRNLQSQAFGEGMNDIAYNFAVDPAGRLFELRGWHNRNGANGTTSSNSHAWAVVSLSGPGNRLPAAERESVLWLAQEGAHRWAAVHYVKPHRQVPGVSTFCPGDERAAYAKVMEQKLHDTAPAPEPPKPPQVKVERELMLIYAPANQQNQGRGEPAFFHLDTAERVIVAHNGAKFKEAGTTMGDSTIYKLPGTAVGWCFAKNPDGSDGDTVLVSLKEKWDKPLHYHFA